MTARELLAMTSEFPDSKGSMLILLDQYRHALRDIAAESVGRFKLTRYQTFTHCRSG